MNHLPLLLSVAVLIVAGFLLLTGGREEEDEPRPPQSPVPGQGEPRQPPSASPSPPPAQPAELEPPPEALRPDGTQVDLSQKFATYVAEDVPLAEALEEVGRLLGCDVSFSDAAWDRVAAGNLTLHLEDVGAPTVLNVLTEPYGVVYRVHRGVLWILMPGEEPPEKAR